MLMIQFHTKKIITIIFHTSSLWIECFILNNTKTQKRILKKTNKNKWLYICDYVCEIYETLKQSDISIERVFYLYSSLIMEKYCIQVAFKYPGVKADSFVHLAEC